MCCGYKYKYKGKTLWFDESDDTLKLNGSALVCVNNISRAFIDDMKLVSEVELEWFEKDLSKGVACWARDRVDQEWIKCFIYSYKPDNHCKFVANELDGREFVFAKLIKEGE